MESGSRSERNPSVSLGRRIDQPRFRLGCRKQETQARLQSVSGRAVALSTTAGSFEEKIAQAVHGFAGQLEGQSTAHLARVQMQLDDAATVASGRAHTQLEAAAAAAAASFGRVLHGISDQEAQQFRNTSWNVIHDSMNRTLRRLAQEFEGSLTAAAGTAQEQFRERLTAEIGVGVEQSHTALDGQLNFLLDELRARSDAQQKSWVENLERVREEITARQQERLQSSADAWVVSSVGRLNEHGQGVIESLMRTAEQSLQDSCSTVLEGLAAVLRDRSKIVSGTVSSIPEISREVSEHIPSPNQIAADDQTQ